VPALAVACSSLLEPKPARLRKAHMTGNKPIPDWLRPKNLLDLVKLKGKYINRKGNTVRQSGQTRGYYFFLVTFKSGGHGICTRAVNDPREAMLPIYILVTSAHIRKRVHFFDNIDQLINEHFEENCARAVAETRLNDALRDSGISIKI
jgi:hypothetical protein